MSQHAAARACVAVDGADVRLGSRDSAPPEPAGELVQAGPLLVREGEIVTAGDRAPTAGSSSPSSRP